MSDFDEIFSHKKTKKFVKKEGWEAFLNLLQDSYPNHDLYKVSMDWYDDMSYICKAKGEMGDVIIGWKERGDK
ncbi:hypothetical protein SAMN05877753_111139 [Bacillus oleivorans]|uniref:Uncharacterized protein n=1 Tax=Bacillus oleivorans TaxID=1448271 RepID=A0A285D697_9BACI|nr:hypothetical protein [Bacillus oleivorans]SNX75299.1 hypothetical protein SAMN05877753_111139 [Bacillus oleivorans]